MKNQQCAHVVVQVLHMSEAACVCVCDSFVNIKFKNVLFALRTLRGMFFATWREITKRFQCPYGFE